MYYLIQSLIGLHCVYMVVLLAQMQALYLVLLFCYSQFKTASIVSRHYFPLQAFFSYYRKWPIVLVTSSGSSLSHCLLFLSCWKIAQIQPDAHTNIDTYTCINLLQSSTVPDVTIQNNLLITIHLSSPENKHITHHQPMMCQQLHKSYRIHQKDANSIIIVNY